MIFKNIQLGNIASYACDMHGCKYGQMEGIPILSDMLQLYISVDTAFVSAPSYSLGAGFVGYWL